MMVRKVVCGVCGTSHTETLPGEGWPGWGQLQGIVLDGDENPYLCPTHLSDIAGFTNTLRMGVGNGVD